MKPEIINVIKMLSKPIPERMPFQGVELTKFIKKIPFFKQYFSMHSQGFVSMCLSCNLMKFYPGQSIYEKESRPENIYVIIDGNIEIFSQNQSQKNSPIKLRQISGYNVLGNVQVVFKQKNRGQNPIAKSEVYAMVIHEQSFLQIWEKSEQLHKAFRYLSTNPSFQQLEEYELKHLSLFMKKKMFEKNQVLRKQGEENSSILYVIFGRIEVVKRLDFKNKGRNVIIEQLEEMCSYGEYQNTSNQKNQASLICATSGTYYEINFKEASENCRKYQKIISNQALPYPQKQQLQFRLRIQKQIEIQKNKVKNKIID